MPQLWDDTDWDLLLQFIQDRKVIPVIGPGMVKVPVAGADEDVSLFRVLAPTLAQRLGIEHPERYDDCRDVARAYMAAGGNNSRQRLLPKFAQLMRDFDGPVPAGLAALARIRDFDLYVSSTPDPMMARALAERPGFNTASHLLRFKTKLRRQELRDIPAARATAPTLFHILGECGQPDDFAVLEEDYIEFIIALIERKQEMPVLTTTLKEQSLLLLGAPSEDLVVRFLLRVARGQRLSDVSDERQTYLADIAVKLGEPMVFFFDRMLRSTRVIDGSPIAFAIELERRWRARQGTDAADAARADLDQLLATMPDEAPRDCVFISYSRDDLDRLLPYLRALARLSVPIWLDKRGLRAGVPFGAEIEVAIKERSALFCAFVSQATEADPIRFVHRERQWAAERQAEGQLYYLPYMVDLPVGAMPRQEPARILNAVHYASLTTMDPESFARDVAEKLRRKREAIHG